MSPVGELLGSTLGVIPNLGEVGRSGYAGPVLLPCHEGQSVFRRTKSDPEQPATPPKPDGKGRPTPTRREAEAAARARAKPPRSRRELSAVQRQRRSEESQRMRQAMRTGDERNLPARDKGPVKRFVRDFVDSRFSFIDLLLPVLLVTLVLSYSGSTTLASYANAILLGSLMLVAVDMVTLRIKLRRELTRRFPGQSYSGTTYYAVMRALQMKFMRLPKSRVKIGQQLPEDYH